MINFRHLLSLSIGDLSEKHSLELVHASVIDMEQVFFLNLQPGDVISVQFDHEADCFDCQNYSYAPHVVLTFISHQHTRKHSLVSGTAVNIETLEMGVKTLWLNKAGLVDVLIQK